MSHKSIIYSNDEVVEDEEALGKLLVERWKEACALFPSLEEVSAKWGTGESDHFRTSRGLAVTRIFGPNLVHVIFSERALGQAFERVDAIVRHEIGHIMDFCGVLPIEDGYGRERWADEVARRVWGQLIRYDDEDIQTLGPGASPRPERLGLQTRKGPEAEAPRPSEVDGNQPKTKVETDQVSMFLHADPHYLLEIAWSRADKFWLDPLEVLAEGIARLGNQS